MAIWRQILQTSNPYCQHVLTVRVLSDDCVKCLKSSDTSIRLVYWVSTGRIVSTFGGRHFQPRRLSVETLTRNSSTSICKNTISKSEGVRWSYQWAHLGTLFSRQWDSWLTAALLSFHPCHNHRSHLRRASPNIGRRRPRNFCHEFWLCILRFRNQNSAGSLPLAVQD